MKQILLILTIAAMFTSNASARHMAVYEDTDNEIAKTSPHLAMTFY